MTLQEFSLEFDILYNNITSNSAPPLDEYEKSVFLTMAQLEIVKELYSGRNQLGLAVETNEEVRQYLNSLIKESNEIPFPSYVEKYGKYKKYTLTTLNRNNYIAILREWIEAKDSVTKTLTEVPIYPATQDTIVQILNNPFKGVTRKRAIKVETDNQVHIYYLPTTGTSNYLFKWTYLAKPSPIILEIDSTEDLSIDGKDISIETPCKLPEVLHRDILRRAVELAKQAYVGQA